ncbi:WecB/TagA/CpsF family glycosyltransferase [Rhodococcus sp. 15-649-2-2]|uniref:WecB/TagA/CpsF family glycosyltransferase n=1 Tax=Rhodococcus sp. 15-649-2-2 TaxID=2023140 RepID=UPI0015C59F07|nr:WecB/TagA/CpsF family glycosyltransferase [Rhodococcus sp. 15-649-2-2]
MNHNLHSVLLAHTNSDFSNSYQTADAVLIDGFPLRLMLQLGTKKADNYAETRVGSCDWILEMEKCGPIGVRRIAVIGASPESNNAVVDRFSKTMPHVRVHGWNGYGELSSLIINDFDELNEFAPDLVLLGLGMPKQEIVLDFYYDRLPDAIYATVGGAIDQLSGFQRMPPRKLGNLGLEWLFRLVRDPRRLAFRYLIEPIILAYFLLKRKGKNANEGKGTSI